VIQRHLCPSSRPPKVTCTHFPQFWNTGLRGEEIKEHEFGLGSVAALVTY